MSSFIGEPPSMRYTNTTKSTLFTGPTTKGYDINKQDLRTKKFEGTPLTSGPTRQSYQDSNIFGTKRGTELVQKSALMTKEVN